MQQLTSSFRSDSLLNHPENERRIHAENLFTFFQCNKSIHVSGDDLSLVHQRLPLSLFYLVSQQGGNLIQAFYDRKKTPLTPGHIAQD